MSPSSICDNLDKLYMELLHLMHQEIEVKLELEKCMQDGELQLAKSRYIMGQRSVSRLQLPSENSSPFTALATVKQGDSAEDNHVLDICQPDIDKPDPLKWFGFLVPQNLHEAKKAYQNALGWSVKSVNVQCQLNNVIREIEKLTAEKQMCK